jgi:hypothetical protein
VNGSSTVYRIVRRERGIKHNVDIYPHVPQYCVICLFGMVNMCGKARKIIDGYGKG